MKHCEHNRPLMAFCPECREEEERLEGVELRRVLREWAEEEAELRAKVRYWEMWKEPTHALNWKKMADDLKMRRLQIEAALAAEPLTKSDSEEGESCPTCDGRGTIILARGGSPTVCIVCKGKGRVSRMSGAGPPNDQVEVPR